MGDRGPNENRRRAQENEGIGNAALFGLGAVAAVGAFFAAKALLGNENKNVHIANSIDDIRRMSRDLKR